MTTEGEGITFCTLIVLAMVLGFLVGGICLKSIERDRAIRAGVGEYYLDEGNSKQFRYLPCGGRG